MLINRMILGGYEMIFPGDISKMPYLTHGKSRAINAENRTGEKAARSMRKIQEEKKEKAGWQPARLDLHVREVRV